MAVFIPNGMIVFRLFASLTTFLTSLSGSRATGIHDWIPVNDEKIVEIPSGRAVYYKKVYPIQGEGRIP